MMPAIDELNRTLGDLETELQKLKTEAQLISQATKSVDAATRVLSKMSKAVSTLVETMEGIADKLSTADTYGRLTRLDQAIDASNRDSKGFQQRLKDDLLPIEQNLKDTLVSLQANSEKLFDIKPETIRALIEAGLSGLEKQQRKFVVILLCFMIPSLLFSFGTLLFLLTLR